MRAIYLIRHGEPDFPGGKRCCLGRMDLSLSEKGRCQAACLKNYLIPLVGAHVLSSPLKRCTETARAAGFGIFDLEERFAEVDTGLWDGLEFSEIRQRWPDEYARRGLDEWNEPFPGGESLNDCYLRAKEAMKKVLQRYPSGDLFIFAHRGVIQALYAYLTRKSREEVLSRIPDYCRPVVLLMNGEEFIAETVLDPEEGKNPFPDEEECCDILKAFGTPKRVVSHCMAVSEKAEKICMALEENGHDLNIRAVRSAAMLHDIARTKKQHAAEGAKILFEGGRMCIAPLVGDHMELPGEEEFFSEKSIVFLADKLVKGTESVSLEERYLSGREGEMLELAKEKLSQANKISAIVKERIKTDI